MYGAFINTYVMHTCVITASLTFVHPVGPGSPGIGVDRTGTEPDFNHALKDIS